MKSIFIILLSAFLLGACTPQEKKTRADLEACQERLSGYHRHVTVLHQELAQLQYQLEVAEDNIIINLVKEFRIYKTKKAREQRINLAINNKQDVEEQIEKTLCHLYSHFRCGH